MEAYREHCRPLMLVQRSNHNRGGQLACIPPSEEGRQKSRKPLNSIDKMAARLFRRKRFEAQNGDFFRAKVTFLIDSKKEKKRDHIFTSR